MFSSALVLIQLFVFLVKMRSRVGLFCRRVLPIAALGTGTFFTVAHCDSFELYKNCASNVYAPHSPEAGLTFEQSGHWQALSSNDVFLEVNNMW